MSIRAANWPLPLPFVFVIGSVTTALLFYLGFVNLLESLVFWGVVGGIVYLLATRYTIQTR